MRATA